MYTETVKAARLAARDVLRTRQVSSRLNKVSSFNVDKKALQTSIDSHNEEALVATVEAEAMPTAHPRRAKAIESAAKFKEKSDKLVASLEKQMADIDTSIAEVNAEITSIETGDGKILVNRDEMQDLASEFVNDRFQDKFVNGDYDAAAKKSDN